MYHEELSFEKRQSEREREITVILDFDEEIGLVAQRDEA